MVLLEALSGRQGFGSLETYAEVLPKSLPNTVRVADPALLLSWCCFGDTKQVPVYIKLPL